MTNATITFKLDDPRWQLFLAHAKGHVSTNVRAEPSTGAKTIDALTAGIPTMLWAIPPEKLTEVEMVYAHDGKFRWHVVKIVERIGWIREDVVRFDLLAPPPKPPLFDKPMPEEIDPTPTRPFTPPETPPTPVPEPPVAIVEPPVVLPPPTPADTVALPAETARAIRELFGKRSNDLKDAARGMLNEAAKLDELIVLLDMALSKQAA